MPDWLASAVQTPGLGWLVVAVIAAGLVRGFAGFGSAMIIMPAASSVLSPFAAIVFLSVVELVGPLPNLPDALRHGARGEVARMLGGAAVGLPVGLALLGLVSPDVFSWGVSCVVMVLLAVLMLGWRYKGQLGPVGVTALGGMGGFLGGISGMPGPPVILFYMSGREAIRVIRANFLLYLMGIDLLMISVLLLRGDLALSAVILGAMLIPIYVGANMLGARLFDPEGEARYRAVAYVIIAASALLGLPVWNGE